jgi:predicted nucleic acid-binding protein
VVLKLFLAEPDSEAADALWQSFARADVEVVAPMHLAYEVTAVIRNRVHRRLLEPGDADEALRTFLTLPVTLHPPEPHHRRAWQLAAEFGRPTTYDVYYLALAEALGCDLWTADERLYNAVHESLPWVRLLGQHRPTG